MGHYLTEVLKSWIESKFRFELFFLLPGKIQSFNKLSRSLLLRLRSRNEGGELIVTYFLTGRQLHHI